MARSLVLQTSYLGDVVLTTPLLAELGRRGPVDVVVSPRGADVLANNPDIDRLVVFDKRGRHRGLLGLRELARQIRAESADSTAYCVQGSVRTAVLAVWAGYRRRAGFDRSQGSAFYTRRVPYRADRHHVERLVDLAAGTGPIAGLPLIPRLYPGTRERQMVDELLGAAGAGDEPLVALAPGSAWATKRWPYFPEFARRVTALGRPVVIGTSEDTEVARDIVETSRGAAIDATGRLPILAAAELVARCAVLVTNDSAPQHLASAMGTPTITVFGPTVPEFGFGPLAPHSRVAERELECRPCDTHGPRVCPLGHWRCMRELGVERVLALATAAAGQRPAPNASHP